MKILHGLISLVVMISLFLVISPSKGFACSCVPVGTVQEGLDDSSNVFSGKVIEIVDPNKNKKIQSSADLIEVKFEVDQSWKGSNQSELIVYTERDSASCGFEFSLNKEYVVYAKEEDGKLRASICSRTAPVASAKEDLTELGQGEKPVKQLSSNTENVKKSEKAAAQDSGNQVYIIFTALGIGLAVGMIVGFIMKGRKR